jgi:hypothetical protein
VGKPLYKFRRRAHYLRIMADEMNTKPTIETVLERINALSEHVDVRINSLDERINLLSVQVDVRSNMLDERINALSEHIDTRFNLSDTRMESIESRLDRLQGGMLDLRADFRDLRLVVKQRIPALPDSPHGLLES